MPYEAVLTLGQVAEHFGIKTWLVQRTIERGFYPQPSKVGKLRVIPRNELPAVRDAIVRAGYLHAEVS
jgi:hypothetical protein